MNHPARNIRHRQAGFSILELLLVLVILSILAGIVGMRFTGQSKEARISAAKAQLSELKMALDTFEIKAGTYPTTRQGLEALVEKPAGMSIEKWPGKMFPRIPKDQWDNEWQYRFPGTQNEEGYDLYSYGPDGQKGGGDDITNWSDNDE